MILQWLKYSQNEESTRTKDNYQDEEEQKEEEQDEEEERKT